MSSRPNESALASVRSTTRLPGRVVAGRPDLVRARRAPSWHCCVPFQWSRASGQHKGRAQPAGREICAAAAAAANIFFSLSLSPAAGRPAGAKQAPRHLAGHLESRLAPARRASGWRDANEHRSGQIDRFRSSARTSCAHLSAGGCERARLAATKQHAAGPSSRPETNSWLNQPGAVPPGKPAGQLPSGCVCSAARLYYHSSASLLIFSPLARWRWPNNWPPVCAYLISALQVRLSLAGLAARRSARPAGLDANPPACWPAEISARRRRQLTIIVTLVRPTQWLFVALPPREPTWTMRISAF